MGMKLPEDDPPGPEVVHHTRLAPVAAEEGHSPEHPLGAEQGGKGFLVADPVLEGEYPGILAEERSDELAKQVIVEGLEPYKHQVHRADFRSGPVTLHLLKVEIAVYRMDRQSIFQDCREIPA
jgi:hypothetical protein